MLHRCQQESPEPPLVWVHASESAAGKQTRKKLLGRIFSLVRSVPTAANEGIERIPIGATQCFQGLLRFRHSLIARTEHKRPVRRRKNGVRSCCMRIKRHQYNFTKPRSS